MHWQKLESGNWNLKAIVWNSESKTVLDSLTWGDTKHFQLRITYMISCFIGVYLSGFIFLDAGRVGFKTVWILICVVAFAYYCCILVNKQQKIQKSSDLQIP